MRRWLALPLLLSAALAVAAPPRPLATVLALQGFDAVWAHRPHRLRALGVGVVPGDGPAPAGTFWSEVVGGSWSTGEHASDVAAVDVAYAGLSWPRGLGAATPIAGSTTLRLQGHTSFEPAHRRSAAASATGLAPWPSDPDRPVAAAWITGFHVATDAGHPFGFTVHRLEVHLGAPTIGEGRVTLPVSAVVEAAPVPDRAQDLEDYGADVVVDWVIVPAARDAVARLDARTDVRDGVALAADADRVRATLVPVTWRPPAGTASVVGALSGFGVELEEEGALDGRYLRALTARLQDARFDPVRGVWEGEVALRFSNEGQITRQVKAELSATVTALALPAGDARGWSGRWRPEATRPGRTTAPYPALAP